MATYLISYDLYTPGQNYRGIHHAIEALGEHLHILRAVWIVKFSGTGQEIIDILDPYIDDNDKLLVVELISGRSVWTGFEIVPPDWLNKA